MADPVLQPPRALGLRERHRLQKFAAIQAAAQRLVAERGLDAVTVEQIAGEADVSPRTFFNYFDNKYAALVDAPPGVEQMLAAALAARPADEPMLTAWRQAWAQTLPYNAEQLYRKISLVRANPALAVPYRAAVGRFEDVVVRWAITRTALDPQHSAYPQLLGAISIAAVNLIFERWNPESGLPGLRAVHAEVFDLLERGLNNPRGRRF